MYQIDPRPGLPARLTLSNVFYVSNRSPARAASPFDPIQRFLGLKSIPGQGYQPATSPFDPTQRFLCLKSIPGQGRLPVRPYRTFSRSQIDPRPGLPARSTLSNVFYVSNRSPARAASPFDPDRTFSCLKSIPGQGYQPVRPYPPFSRSHIDPRPGLPARSTLSNDF